MKILNSFLGLFFCLFSYTQTSWDLEKCLDYSLSTNLSLKQEQLTQDELQKDILIARTVFYPKANLSASHGLSLGLSVDPFTNLRESVNIQNDNLNFGINTSIFRWQNILNLQLSKLVADQQAYQIALKKYELKLKITDLFFQYLYNKNLLKVIENQLNNTTKHIQRIEKQVKYGSKSQSELLELNANYSQSEQEFLNTKIQTKLTKTELLNALYLSSDTLDFELDSISSTPLSDLSYKNNPTLKIYQSTVLLKQKQIQLAKSNYYPDVSFSYSFSTFYSKLLGSEAPVFSFSEQIKNNRTNFFGLTLNVPIFNGLQTKYGVQKAKISLEKSLLQEKQYEIELEQQLKKYLLTQQTLEEKLQGINKTLKLSEESFKKTEIKYKEGMIDFFAFISSRNALMNLEYQKLKAELEIQLNQKLLAIFCGN